ncbi:Adenylate and Guanylate cyclase catalytic domain containing protein [Tritrichomonas foetus]|uniref:Adenylate and Guanylate cyclase catalytic domain containing protein n=1 Tax=Tritrichomonas foetus TaxID=1144522 RepID=A0A1J4JZN1_9EUKA|nr:Adenylate and Guanylate cyclase catalytic domain containing protein [Tritrichomonas foetus]|eukprot:OHT02950.1 Adenylate and Guanylate cyclase catalytic domain containing protein [Tritrichomonas foetus]
MNIISVVFQIIPIKFIEDIRVPFLIAYCAILGVVLILIIFSTLYFHKNASLSIYLAIILALFFAIVIQILPPIAISMIFRLFSAAANGSDDMTVGNIILIVISMIFTITYIYLMNFIVYRSLAFKPNSLMTVSSVTWGYQYFEPIVLNCLIGFASKFEGKSVQYIMVAIIGVIYWAYIILPFYQGGFIHDIIQKAVITTNAASGILCFVNCYFCSTTKYSSIVMLFSYVGGWVIIYIIVHIIINRRSLKYLKKIDEIAEDTESFPIYIKSPNQFLNIMKVGIENAHFMCLNWSLCRMAVDRWPKNQNVWYAFAKYVVIYPEDSQTLDWIIITLNSNKIKGTVIKSIKEQCLQISRQRESVLSSDLKIKISKLNKQTNSTKHKLRHVWDAVLQGVIREVEEATKRARTAIEQNNIDFQRLLRQFPNNRFVTRPYARFLLEIVGDTAQAAEMLEKSRLLQRNIIVNPDQTHVCGLLAFPNLPEHTRDQMILNPQRTESSFLETCDDLGDNPLINNENTMILKEQINNLHIPGIRNAIILRYFILIVVFIIPVIVGMVLVYMVVSKLLTPIEHIYNLSIVKTCSNQIMAYTNRLLYTALGIFPEVKPIHDNAPEHLGGSWDISTQFKFIIHRTTTYLQKLSTFQSYNQNNEYIKKTHDLVFEHNIPYQFYQNPNNYTVQNLNVQGCLIDFITQVSVIVDDTSSITFDTLDSAVNYNIVGNGNVVAISINNALGHLVDYMINFDTSYRKLSLILEIVLTIVVVILHIGALVLQIIWIKENKESLFLCLTSLPKNTVSQLAENLRILKKDATTNSSMIENSDISKQEENILKVFNTGGSHELNFGDVTIIAYATIINLGLEIACIFILCLLLNKEASTIKKRGPQFDYMQNCYSSLMGAIFLAQYTSLIKTPYKYAVYDDQFIRDIYQAQLELTWNYYSLVKYGSEDIYPYTNLDPAIQASTDYINCTEYIHKSSGFGEAVSCYNADLVFTSMLPYIHQYAAPWLFEDAEIDTQSSALNDIWVLAGFPIYDGFIAPEYEKLTSLIEDLLSSQMNSRIEIIIILYVVGIVIEIIATIRLKVLDNDIKFVLKLLLHCQPDVVLQIPAITQVLSGDFSVKKNDKTTFNHNYFNSILQNMPDVILCSDHMNNIESINKQGKVLINCSDDDLIGKPVTVFLSRFDGSINNLLSPTTNVVNEELSMKRDTETIYFNATSSLVNQKLIITMRDITISVRYNTLIKEERQKSDLLLSSILPKSLVARVQNGEKNISFAVQSVTIVFMDIVSFTPWCSCFPADQVMSTLNNLFKKFDSSVGHYSTMTKIKCIGDCYMAAGGVFAEVNQPAEHAKDVVNFGLDSLEHVTSLNEELNQSLQIRVGINTGGPIVAGVLGIGKPTFEILGPVINMAQQMEHHGVPQNVHISRTVYELVYGDTFVIKERGPVEVKGGTVVTYLVSGRK